MTPRYEITAQHATTGSTFLVGYSPRVSRLSLLAAMLRFGNAIFRRLDMGVPYHIALHAQPSPHCIIGEWRIAFTGRTQHKCAGSEHPHIAEFGRSDRR
jgi:hypothetical protein